MKTYKDQKEFSWDNPKAWAMLPKAYRNDSCLQFFKTGSGLLLAEPKPDQVEALGHWTGVFLPRTNTWADLKTFTRGGLANINPID